MMTAQSSDQASLSAPASSPKLASVSASDTTKQPGADDKTELAPNGKPELNCEYVTGAKLAVIVAAVAFAGFLTLLDTMIVSTVGRATGH